MPESSVRTYDSKVSGVRARNRSVCRTSDDPLMPFDPLLSFLAFRAFLTFLTFLTFLHFL